MCVCIYFSSIQMEETIPAPERQGLKKKNKLKNTYIQEELQKKLSKEIALCHYRSYCDRVRMKQHNVKCHMANHQ